MPFDPTIGGIDFAFLPPNFNGDVQVFSSDNNAQGSFKWIKPRGVTMCYMVCIGGGGGGGSGRGGASTTARGGGAGGACSGMSKMIIPAIFLPDTLVVQVGNGGAGGAGGAGAGNNGGAGTNSIISHGVGLTGISSQPNTILTSNNAAPGGGGAGTAAAGGTGGSVPTISTDSISATAVTWSIRNYLVGTVGSAGGAQTGAIGVQVGSVFAGIGVTPGAGGAGVNTVATGFAGGAINLVAAMDFADGSLSPTGILPGGVAGGAGAAGNGNSGIQLWKPFVMTGGSGGGSSDGSTGGNGGNGGIGCGGGGGGGGVTAGSGGNGGNGIVVIISW